MSGMKLSTVRQPPTVRRIERSDVIEAVSRKLESETDSLTDHLHLTGYQLIEMVSDAVTKYNEEEG